MCLVSYQPSHKLETKAAFTWTISHKSRLVKQYITKDNESVGGIIKNQHQFGISVELLRSEGKR